MAKPSCPEAPVGDEGEIERSLLAYLRNRPRAADTLEGIVDWWLPLQRYETARTRIEQALDKLVVGGVLRTEFLPGGAVLYALNPDPAPPQAQH